MLAGRLDGVSADDDVARATLSAIRYLVRDRPTVYLPTHDPESAERLSNYRPGKSLDISGGDSRRSDRVKAGDRAPHAKTDPTGHLR
jgi:glyoxylase-like metal-dependent hydrolase (beta-lactamase superfamily II)